MTIVLPKKIEKSSKSTANPVRTLMNRQVIYDFKIYACYYRPRYNYNITMHNNK